MILLRAEIEDIGVNGEGIGKIDGYTLFIKDAVIGDVVEAKIMKAKKSYGYARLMKILRPSPDRVSPKCPYARKCGGVSDTGNGVRGNSWNSKRGKSAEIWSGSEAFPGICWTG